jgi:hypothetical protein
MARRRDRRFVNGDDLAALDAGDGLIHVKTNFELRGREMVQGGL